MTKVVELMRNHKEEAFVIAGFSIIWGICGGHLYKNLRLSSALAPAMKGANVLHNLVIDMEEDTIKDHPEMIGEFLTNHLMNNGEHMTGITVFCKKAQ